MKKLLLVCFMLVATTTVFAQAVNNVLNSTGNAGIGTTSPSSYSGYSVLSIDNATSGGVLNFRKNGTLLGQLWADPVGEYLWAGTGLPLHISTDGNEKMTLLTNGNIGIGTTTPLSKLEVNVPWSTGPCATFHLNGAQVWGNVMTLATDNTGPGDDPKLMFSYRHGTKQWSVGGRGSSNTFGIYENSSDGNFGSPSQATNWGVGLERFTILEGGNVGIGTTNPGTYKLAVAGNVHAQGVLVDMNGWSDYVFKKTYVLPSLKTVKTYIDLNHHLPGMPSESEVVKNGLNLGDMNKVLTKKIEELTLYLIDKDKQLNDQKRTLTKQENELEQQGKRIQALEAVLAKLTKSEFVSK